MSTERRPSFMLWLSLRSFKRLVPAKCGRGSAGMWPPVYVTKPAFRMPAPTRDRLLSTSQSSDHVVP